jgi:hypothetical protein
MGDIAINLDDSMAPDTIIELRQGAVVRFLQDTSDASGVAARGRTKRAWVKDEVSGCKFYSLPFSLPARRLRRVVSGLPAKLDASSSPALARWPAGR